MVPDNLLRALERASAETYENDGDVLLKVFLGRWGGYTPEIFARVLQAPEEYSHEKIFTLSALGHCAFPESASLLIPFLRSTKRAERWTSALSLGRLRHEAAFPVLQDLLVEGLADFQYFETHEDPYANEQWCMNRRFLLSFLLGNWKNPTATPTLRQALLLCWQREIEQAQRASGSETRQWHAFQNSLAYALGQLEAWGVLLTLQLPPGHWRIAFLHFLFGTLHAVINEGIPSRRHRFGLFSPLLDQQLFFEYHSDLVSEQIRFPLEQRDRTLVSPYIDVKHLHNVLQNRFGLTTKEQEEYLLRFWQAYDQRRLEDGHLWPVPTVTNIDDFFLDGRAPLTGVRR